VTAPRIRPARAEDAPAIATLLDSAFDGVAESTLVAALRAEGAVAVELVIGAGEVRGHVMFTRAPVGEASRAGAGPAGGRS
jgi:putative acetyltransferase